MTSISFFKDKKSVFPVPTFLSANVHDPPLANANVAVSPDTTPLNVPSVQLAVVFPSYCLLLQLDTVGVNVFFEILAVLLAVVLDN